MDIWILEGKKKASSCKILPGFCRNALEGPQTGNLLSTTKTNRLKVETETATLYRNQPHITHHSQY